jgi:hypothetical protein
MREGRPGRYSRQDRTLIAQVASSFREQCLDALGRPVLEVKIESLQTSVRPRSAFGRGHWIGDRLTG